MTGRLIPAGSATVKVEDATVDLICFGHALAVLGDRRAAGRLTGYVEATLAANPHLAGAGAILPRGMVIRLPAFEIQAAAPGPQLRRLWDEE